jgi:hypothetical protein
MMQDVSYAKTSLNSLMEDVLELFAQLTPFQRLMEAALIAHFTSDQMRIDFNVSDTHAQMTMKNFSQEVFAERSSVEEDKS